MAVQPASKSFLDCTAGGFATTIGVAAVPLMLVAGTAIDYTMMHSAESALQEIADGAALAGVKELSVAATSKTTTEEVAENYANTMAYERLNLGSDDSSVVVNASLATAGRELTVSMAYYWKPMMLHFIKPDTLPLKVSATATLAGSESICVIALEPNDDDALSISSKSLMKADNCSVYSNSKSSKGLSIEKEATLSAVNSYTSGGFDGPLDSYKPRPITDARKFPILFQAGSCPQQATARK